MSTALKCLPTPWTGDVLLACRKCQKKLKAHHPANPLARIRKAVKRFNKEHSASPLHVIQVGCMDICPKNAVTVFAPNHRKDRVCLLRHESELTQLSAGMKSPD